MSLDDFWEGYDRRRRILEELDEAMTNTVKTGDGAQRGDTLLAVDKEELAAAVRLLATGLHLSIKKVSDDPLSAAADSLTMKGRDQDELQAPARELIERAFVMLSAQTQTRVAVGMGSGATQSEARRQHRIKLSSSIIMRRHDLKAQTHGLLRDISWGGASVSATESLAKEGDAVWLMLPVGANDEIPILSTVLRIRKQGRNMEFGLRFDSMRPEDEPRFRKVLEILMDGTDSEGQRGESRLVHRLDIEYGDTGDLRSTLEDISAGGLKLMLPDPLELQESILIVLSSVDGLLTLELRARVVHQTEVTEGGLPMYRTGLQFEHSQPDLKASVAKILQEVVVRENSGDDGAAQVEVSS